MYEPPVLHPFNDFEQASRTVLNYLHQQLGFDLWMMTRTEGDDWIVLQVEDHGYKIREGSVLQWSDSFCSRMVKGEGPCVAPDVKRISAYSQAPIAQQVSIGAYIGVPVCRQDGSLFGTLCAVSPEPQPESITEHLPVVQLLARLLGTILDFELQTIRQQRELQEVAEMALTDSLTGISNRRAWELRLQEEELRSRRYGCPVSVIIIDLDGLKEINDTDGHAAGDTCLRQAAKALQSVVRSSDMVARIGGDEFGILAIECDTEAARHLVSKIRLALDTLDIEASIGFAQRNPEQGLAQAINKADSHMYREKASHHNP